MSRGLSLPAEALVDYASARGAEAVAAEALRVWVAAMRLPGDALAGLPFDEAVRGRWDTAVDNRVTELTGLRDRLGHTASRLCQAAADFTDVDVAAAVDLARAAGDEQLVPLLTSRFAGAVTITAVPDGAAAPPDFAAAHTEGEVPSTVDPNCETDTPGPPRLRALRAEHLAMLSRAEQLLADAQRLDFKRPTAFLAELERVRPGVVRTRADLLAVAASTVAAGAETAAAQTRTLTDAWQGGAAVTAFAEHARATDGQQRAVTGELGWLREQGERLWRLVDGLLCDIVDDAEQTVDSVADSRIGRIKQAVELLDDTTANAPDDSGASAWGWYSGADVDLVVQVLYKRVWYLSRAFATSVDRAVEAADELLDNSAHPVTAAPITTGDADWTGDWSLGEPT